MSRHVGIIHISGSIEECPTQKVETRLIELLVPCDLFEGGPWANNRETPSGRNLARFASVANPIAAPME